MTIYSLLPQRHSQTPQGQGWTVHGTEEVQEEKERRGHSLACSISATRQQGPACDLAAMAEEISKRVTEHQRLEHMGSKVKTQTKGNER